MFCLCIFSTHHNPVTAIYTSPNGSTCTLESELHTHAVVSTIHGRHARMVYRVYLCMRTLVVHLGQGPIVPGVSGEEYGVLFPRLLFQLDGDGDQVVGFVHVQQAERSRTVVTLPTWQSI